MFPNGLNLPEQGTQNKVPRTRYPRQGTQDKVPRTRYPGQDTQDKALCKSALQLVRTRTLQTAMRQNGTVGSLWHCRIALEYLYNYKCGYFQVSHSQCKILKIYTDFTVFQYFLISHLYLHLNMFRLNIHTFSTLCLGLFVG